MSKNPFSIYDFMGYLFPGVVCYFCLSLLVQFDGDFSKLTDIAEIKEVLSKNDSRFDLDRSVVFVVFSYILGHIVSYVSSLTIEQFAIKVFGYPSTYLLEKEPKVYNLLWKDFF